MSTKEKPIGTESELVIIHNLSGNEKWQEIFVVMETTNLLESVEFYTSQLRRLNIKKDGKEIKVLGLLPV